MARSERLTRVELCSIDESKVTSPNLGGTYVQSKMNVLVDAQTELKVGKYITLSDSEDPNQKWLVLRIHETLDRVDIKHGWNNNI